MSSITTNHMDYNLIRRSYENMDKNKLVDVIIRLLKEKFEEPNCNNFSFTPYNTEKENGNSN